MALTPLHRLARCSSKRGPSTGDDQVARIGQLEQIPAGLYRDGAWYYGDHHFHPRSQSRYTAMSLQDLMAFDAEEAALVEFFGRVL